MHFASSKSLFPDHQGGPFFPQPATQATSKAVKLLKMLPGMSAKEDTSKVKSGPPIFGREVGSRKGMQCCGKLVRFVEKKPILVGFKRF